MNSASFDDTFVKIQGYSFEISKNAVLRRRKIFRIFFCINGWWIATIEAMLIIVYLSIVIFERQFGSSISNISAKSWIDEIVTSSVFCVNEFCTLCDFKWLKHEKFSFWFFKFWKCDVMNFELTRFPGAFGRNSKKHSST